MPNEPIYLRDVQDATQAAAHRVRRLATAHGMTLVVLDGPPGAGRTGLIAAAAKRLPAEVKVAAIVAATTGHADAESLATLMPVVSIELGRRALDAAMVEQALGELAPREPRLVLIERGAPLGAPTPPLGETARAIVVTVATAAHLPTKHGAGFADCGAVVVNMTDLAALTDFRQAPFAAAIHAVNARAAILPLSCRTGDGVDGWAGWLARFL